MISRLRKYVTTEPTFFFVSIWREIFVFLNQNLYLQKECRYHRLSAPDLSTACDDEKRGLVFVSTVLNNYIAAGKCWSLVFLIYASNYSDAAGGKRKLFILLPLLSMTAQALWALLQVIFWDWSSVTGVVVDVILENAFGGFSAVDCFVHAILLDMTMKEHRLHRITILATIFGAAHFIGKGCAGYLLRNAGFFSTIILSLAFLILALVSAVVLVQDHVTKSTTDNYQSVNWTISRIFSFKPVTDILRLVCPKKPKRILASLWMLMLIIVLHFFPTMGERSVTYLYFRYRFHWNEEKYSVYSAFRMLSLTIGGLLCTLVMKKWLKIPDAMIGAFAALCDTLSVVGCYFAAEDWQVYAVALIDMFHGVVNATAFSLLSQYFTGEEYGQLNSMKIIYLVMGGGAGVPIYGALFKTTMDTHPAAIFLLSTFLNTILCIIFSIVYFVRRDRQSQGEGKGDPTS